MKTSFIYFTAFISVLSLFTACSKDDIVVPTKGTDISRMGKEVMVGPNSDARNSNFRYSTYNGAQERVGNGPARTIVSEQ